jgi:hypothetical protein
LRFSLCVRRKLQRDRDVAVFRLSLWRWHAETRRGWWRCRRRRHDVTATSNILCVLERLFLAVEGGAFCFCPRFGLTRRLFLCCCLALDIFEDFRHVLGLEKGRVAEELVEID